MPSFLKISKRLLSLIKINLVIFGTLFLVTVILEEAAFKTENLTISLLFAALLLNQINLVLFAERMRLSLAAFEIKLPLKISQSIHLQSLFYYFFIPMSVGLEIARFLKIQSYAPQLQKTDLAIAIIADRLTGVIGTLVICIWTFAFIQVDLPHINHKAFFWIAAFGSIGAFAIILLKFTDNSRLHVIIHLVADAKKIELGLAVLIGCFMQLSMSLCVYLGVLSLGFDVAFLPIVFGVAVGTLATIIPISFMGAGPDEVSKVGALMLAGVPLNESILVASLAYIGKLIGAIEGGMIEAWEDKKGLGKSNGTIQQKLD